MNQFSPLDEIYLNVFCEKVAEYTGYLFQSQEEALQAVNVCSQLKQAPLEKSASFTQNLVQSLEYAAEHPDLAPYLDAVQL